MTRPRPSILPALAALALPAFAQDKTESLEPVTVRGAVSEWAVPADIRTTLGMDIDPATLPMASERFDADLSLNRGDATLRDVLENSAGAVTALGNGVHDFFVVRGFDSLDGATLALVFTGDHYHLITTFNLAHV